MDTFLAYVFLGLTVLISIYFGCLLVYMLRDYKRSVRDFNGFNINRTEKERITVNKK